MGEKSTMSGMGNDAINRWKSFGAWLRGQREQARRSQKEVAALTGLHAVQISRIETGESGTKPETLDLLIRALSLDRAEAYRRAGFWPEGAPPPEEPQPDPFSAALSATIEAFRSLPASERRRLLRVLIISFGDPAELGDRAFEISDPADFSQALSGRIDQMEIPKGKLKP